MQAFALNCNLTNIISRDHTNNFGVLKHSGIVVFSMFDNTDKAYALKGE